jgi:AhpD family alkylhydroperoxidase
MLLADPTKVPTREDVPPESRGYFDYFLRRLGMMPNLYAVMAFYEPGISSYLRLQQRKKVLNRQESEAIGLVVSAAHKADYCLANHVMIARLNGLDDTQIAEIRGGAAPFDAKLDALVRLVLNIMSNNTKADAQVVQDFYAAGYEFEHLVDVVITIADNVISNIVSNILELPADDPVEWVARR